MFTAIRLALSSVPKFAWEAMCAGLAVVLLACGAQLAITWAHLNTTRTTLATQTATWANERARLAEAARLAESSYRAAEAQRARDNQIAQENHDALEARSRSAADRSAGQLDRLQHALQIAANALRRGTSGDPATASEREAGATAADVLGECGARYRELGRQADRAYASGQQCEQRYDALTR